MSAIDITAQIDIEPIEITASVDLTPPEGVTDHNDLTGKDSVSQHPASSIDIEGTSFTTVQDLAEAVDDTEEITFDSDTILGTGTASDPYAVNRNIDFFATQQTTAFTITADMNYKVVEINAVSDVDVTVSNMDVGTYIRFDILGAGLPNFVINETTQAINEKDLTDRVTIYLERQPDVLGIEQYKVI